LSGDEHVGSHNKSKGANVDKHRHQRQKHFRNARDDQEEDEEANPGHGQNEDDDAVQDIFLRLIEKHRIILRDQVEEASRVDCCKEKIDRQKLVRLEQVNIGALEQVEDYAEGEGQQEVGRDGVHRELPILVDRELLSNFSFSNFVALLVDYTDLGEVITAIVIEFCFSIILNGAIREHSLFRAEVRIPSSKLVEELEVNE